MATIRDVAEKAGVSVATVSRVLNNSGYADPSTAQRVLRAVEELDYRRNVHWSRLASKSARTVMFLLANRESLNSMQMELLVSCERTLHKADYDLAFSRHIYEPHTRPPDLTLPRLMQQQGALDGVILAGVHTENFLRRLDAMKLPYVILGSNFSGNEKLLSQNSIQYDDESGVFEATTYLLRLGHRRIGFLGDTGKAWFARRYRGYERAMNAAGAEKHAITAPWSVTNVDYGMMGAAEFLRTRNGPTAIVAANDEIAAGAWKELVRKRVSIPDEMSLVGFGDRAEFSILEPALTTVTVFAGQLGERLAAMLLERLSNGAKPVPSQLLPVKLVERHSCGPYREALALTRPARR
jgi:DNA-binding LacI/PurR family transcriptional regulator